MIKGLKTKRPEHQDSVNNQYMPESRGIARGIKRRDGEQNNGKMKATYA